MKQLLLILMFVPCILGSQLQSRPSHIFMIGDSTMADKDPKAEPERGWGQELPTLFDDSVKISNHAVNGRSSKSFIDEGRWQIVLDSLQAGDYVIIQFGHNDQKPDEARHADSRTTYKSNLEKYVKETRAKGAFPILCTSIVRRKFNEKGVLTDTHGDYPDTVRRVSKEFAVPLLDLQLKTKLLISELGPEKSKSLYLYASAGAYPNRPNGVQDDTHLNSEGAAEVARMAVEEMKALKLPLVNSLKASIPQMVQPWSVRMVESLMKRQPEQGMIKGFASPLWEYTPGLELKAVLAVWEKTKDQRYLDYVTAYYNKAIQEDGNILLYKASDYNIDRINPGKPLFRLYEITDNEKYKKALFLLRDQMKTHPRVSTGGFWHKKSYPNQMWLDGIYMASPLLAQFAVTFNEPTLLDDVANQIILMERYARDEKTGLLYHGWDESREQRWADPTTGRSPNFWGRGMGWYAMALVDVLDFFPKDHPKRAVIISILKRLAEAAAKVQDEQTGVWYQVLDQAGREGNYAEASASCMFVYALAKGVRNGYIDARYRNNVLRGYAGILKEFIEVDASNLVNLNRVCAVAGLGGNPYRDGSYDYYIHTAVVGNDPKGVGPFILASLEMEAMKK
jgi:unsaturated rhamnogalacturonyl hydrolase